RRQNRQHGCSNLVAPFEQLLAMSTPLASVVIESAWGNRDLLTPSSLSELVSQFDPRTRILLLGPVPIFRLPSLDCIVLGDRFGECRARSSNPRNEVDESLMPVVRILETAPTHRENVRFDNPIDLFCDRQACRPDHGDTVYYRDSGHVSPAGA